MPTRRRIAWAVAALSLAACTSASGPSGVTPRPAGAPPDGVRIEDVEIGGLSLDEPDWKPAGANWILRLTWDAPADIDIDHYEVRRDGVTVADDVEPTSYRDDDVEPGARYRYEVVGVDGDGGETSRGRISIRTGEPSLSDARLEGTFAVRMVVDRASGTRNPVRGGAIFFSFHPKCGSGPCGVRWTVRRARTDGMLKRGGAVYAASLRTPLFVRNCFGRVIDERLKVRLRVTDAGPLRGAWRATRIEGTIRETSSYRGCVTATIDWNVSGSLQS